MPYLNMVIINQKKFNLLNIKIINIFFNLIKIMALWYF